MADATARVSREKLRGLLRALPSLLSGRAGSSREVEQILAALGLEALGIIREAFVEKSRGGTDAAGLSWAPLSARTVAYSRRHPALERKRKRAASERRPTLTRRQDALWRKTFARVKRAALKKGAGEGEAARRAAAVAWHVVKAAGGRTVLDVYGGTKVETLRDTGRLLASLSPGRKGGDQVFDVGPGSVRVGTNVEYARAHHLGNPRRGLPARPLWPEPGDWPAEWTDRLRHTLGEALKRALPGLLRGL